MAFHKVLIAVDGTPVSTHAADVGLELARSVGAEIAFVHVVDPSEAYELESSAAPAEVLAAEEENGKTMLAYYQQRSGAEPPPLAFPVVGSPARAIVRTARGWAADVVVLGSHGRTGITRVLLGSVAESVMRNAPCPVLVVRAPEGT